MSSIQRKIWESRIKDLHENTSTSSSGAKGAPNTFSGGVAGLAADIDNPVSPEMGRTDGDKKPSGKITTQRWDGEKGEYKQEIQVPWSVKVVADDISFSREALGRIRTELGGLTKNRDVANIIAKKVGADFHNLISTVGLKTAANIISGGKDPTIIHQAVPELLPPPDPEGSEWEPPGGWPDYEDLPIGPDGRIDWPVGPNGEQHPRRPPVPWEKEKPPPDDDDDGDDDDGDDDDKDAPDHNFTIDDLSYLISRIPKGGGYSIDNGVGVFGGENDIVLRGGDGVIIVFKEDGSTDVFVKGPEYFRQIEDKPPNP